MMRMIICIFLLGLLNRDSLQLAIYYRLASLQIWRLIDHKIRIGMVQELSIKLSPIKWIFVLFLGVMKGVH